jgi:cellulose synthase/poly-beta-1,6-N-acetylglucosamine synthase-like glycosyltransferase
LRLGAVRRFLLHGGLLFPLGWPVVYPFVLWLIAKALGRSEPTEHRPAAELPSLTVIVPAYRERGTIERRLANLSACDYPRDRFRVLVVVSGADDGTAEAVEAWTADGLVRLIREEKRSGKAGAINLALSAANSELVVVTDANTSFEPDALVNIAANFADPAIGAATGYFEVTGEDRTMESEEKLFWRLRNRLRRLEAAVDSTAFMSGELCCFRRGLIARLDEDTLADDMNVALQVRRQGYRVVVDWTARCSEPRSAALDELSETKSRRAAGGIQELIRAGDLIFNRRYGWFGMLILPSSLLYYLPLRLPALAGLALMALSWFGGLRRATKLRLLAPLALTLPALGMAARGPLRMLVFNEWVFLLGWQRYLTNGMDVRWRQERSTRDGDVEALEARQTR